MLQKWLVDFICERFFIQMMVSGWSNFSLKLKRMSKNCCVYVKYFFMILIDR